MKRMKGLAKDFSEAKVLMMITYSEGGEKRMRPMTNFNSDPYHMMWFPTYRDTRKVRDIEKNNKVLINFPSSQEGEFWEIEGTAELEKDKITSEKWRSWMSYLHKDVEAESYGLVGYSSLVDQRKIINIYPYAAKRIRTKQ